MLTHVFFLFAIIWEDQSFYRRITPTQLKASGTEPPLQYLKKQAVSLYVKAFAGEEEVNFDNYNVFLSYKDPDGDLTIIHTVEDLVAALEEHTDVGTIKILAQVQVKPPVSDNTGSNGVLINVNETPSRAAIPIERIIHSHTDNANGSRLQITIQGSGTPAVDGVYNRGELVSNAWRFAKRGRWNDKDCTFYILQWPLKMDTRYWYICIVPDGQDPGSMSDLDFYKASVQGDCLRIPPKTGWKTAKDGKDPSPELFFAVSSWKSCKCWRAKWSTASMTETTWVRFRQTMHTNIAEPFFSCAV